MMNSIGAAWRAGGMGSVRGGARRLEGGQRTRSTAQPIAMKRAAIAKAGGPMSNQVTLGTMASENATEIAIGDHTSMLKKPCSSATFMRSSRIATIPASPPAACSVLARFTSVPSSVTAPILSAMPKP